MLKIVSPVFVDSFMPFTVINYLISSDSSAESLSNVNFKTLYRFDNFYHLAFLYMHANYNINAR